MKKLNILIKDLNHLSIFIFKLGFLLGDSKDKSIIVVIEKNKITIKSRVLNDLIYIINKFDFKKDKKIIYNLIE